MQSQDINLSTITLAEVVVKSNQFYIQGSLAGKIRVFLEVSAHTAAGPWKSGGLTAPSLLVIAECLACTSEVPHRTAVEGMTE